MARLLKREDAIKYCYFRVVGSGWQSTISDLNIVSRTFEEARTHMTIYGVTSGGKEDLIASK